MKRKILSTAINFIIGIASILGVTLACVLAVEHGYSSPYVKLLYFTVQSNLWIGVVSIIVGVKSVIEIVKKEKIVCYTLYLLKFIFTVSITLTGVIFCALLAPFADFNVWYFSSVLTHVIVPTLSICDLFINQDQPKLKKKHVYLSIVPPLYYFFFAVILGACNVDFGRGEPFPYFFLNFNSEVGLFGFLDSNPPQMGSFYWIVLIILFIIGLSRLYYRFHPATKKYNKN